MISNMEISPAQCRAARGLLNISQARLAELSGVSQRAITGFEAGATRPMRANLMALRMAFEREGVIVLDGNGEGPGVRLRRI
jgi:transcriptional regulator with XRE-family HTH domain